MKLEKLSIGYEEPLISNINLTIYPGQIISIIGASGIGKTTLLRTLAGLVSPLDGSVKLNIKPRGGLGYIPQKLLELHTSTSPGLLILYPLAADFQVIIYIIAFSL